MKRIALVALVAAIAGCQQDTTAPASQAGLHAPSMTVVTTPCDLVTVGGPPTVVYLQGDCQTNQTITLGDNTTLNGNGYTITAVDPEGGHFLGAVITNNYGANNVHVTNVTITASGLASVCDVGGERLRGVLFESTSGSVTYTTVRGINQAGSGCQEGNSIEVRNSPYDGTHPNTVSVEIANNTVSDFMKTGILVNGDVNATVRNNSVGASANQTYLAANSIQFGYGASGVIKSNRIEGNQWCTGAGYIGTAILAYEANSNTNLPISADLNITQNILSGNADAGIYVYGDGMTVNNNKVFDDASITDCNVDGYDVGIFNETWEGAGNNIFKNNKVGGYSDAYLAVSGGNNKTNPNK